MIAATVIIPTYNRSRLLDYSLTSLVNQNARGYQYEVIVVDDGSTDDTGQVVAAYKNRLWIKYCYQTHRGYRVAKARNTGILNAAGAINIFIDCGLIVGTEFVYQHCESHRLNKNCAVIGSIYGFSATCDDKKFLDIFSLDDIDQSIVKLKTSLQYNEIRYRFFKYHEDDFSKSREPWFYFWGGNLSVPKQVLIKVGLFDENFNRWGLEDLDLGYRLSKDKIPLVINEKAEGVHYPHGYSKEIMTLKSTNSPKNTVYFHQKHYCVASEMLVLNKICEYHQELRELWANENRRFDYRRINTKAIFHFLSGKQLLLLGAHHGALLDSLHCEAALEYQQAHYQEITAGFPHLQIYNLFGLKTFFAAKQFETCLITDFWRFLPEKWVMRLLEEAVRISEEVFMVLSIVEGGKVLIDSKKPHVTALFRRMAHKADLTLKLRRRVYKNTNVLFLAFCGRLPLRNARKHLEIPTYEGSGQAVHPDVVYFKDGWNKFRYWMAMTPYPFEREQYENPSIVTSNDGIRWTELAGVNPLVGPPLVGHNCDCDLIYNPLVDQLGLYYIETDDLNYAQINLVISSDGIHWSEKKPIIAVTPRYAMIGQAIVFNHEERQFHMWYVNAGHEGGFGCRDRTVEYRSSSDGINWSNAIRLHFPSETYLPWHLDVIYLPRYKEYWMFYVGTDQALHAHLLLAVSPDGVNWERFAQPVLAKPLNSWDSFNTYRASAVYDEERELIKLWYSAMAFNSNQEPEYHIGYTAEKMSTFMKLAKREAGKKSSLALVNR